MSENNYNEYTICSIFRKVCDAVRYCHHHKVVHRDIKVRFILSLIA